jgi:predicted  nucleic acid-binding Zn-ribbon protein
MTIKKIFDHRFDHKYNNKKIDEIAKVTQRKQHIHNKITDLRRRISNLKTNRPVDIVAVRALALKVTKRIGYN